ncbi:MAG: ankyrin repeat domain-containing protein [Actinomycetota bacterium]
MIDIASELEVDVWTLKGPMSTDSQGEALCAAAHAGDVDATIRLLEAGANVNARNGIQQTPLICAAEAGHAETVQLLLAHGADIEARDDYGDTALLSAANDFHLAVLRVLLDWRANPNVRNLSGFSPLSFCLLYTGERAHAQLALLLERGADPNAADRDGDTPLMNATHEPDYVRLLLKHRADFRTRNHANKTALQTAYENCDYESAELLIKAGAAL